MHCNIVTVPDMVAARHHRPIRSACPHAGWTVDLVAADDGSCENRTADFVWSERHPRDRQEERHHRYPRRHGNRHCAARSPVGRLREAGSETFPIHLRYLHPALCLLGAAGLLQGRRAGGHWQARDLLTNFGAIVSNDRMTQDGNIYTSGWSDLGDRCGAPRGRRSRRRGDGSQDPARHGVRSGASLQGRHPLYLTTRNRWRRSWPTRPNGVRHARPRWRKPAATMRQSN